MTRYHKKKHLTKNYFLGLTRPHKISVFRYRLSALCRCALRLIWILKQEITGFVFWFLESRHFFTNQILENSLVMGTIPFWHRTRECLNFQIVPFLLHFDGENWSRSKIKMKELLSGGVRLYKSTKVNFLPLRQKPLKTLQNYSTDHNEFII